MRESNVFKGESSSCVGTLFFRNLIMTNSNRSSSKLQLCDVKLYINSIPFLLLQASMFPARLVYFQSYVKMVNYRSWSPCFHARETKTLSCLFHLSFFQREKGTPCSAAPCWVSHWPWSFTFTSSTTELHMCRNRCTFKVWAGVLVQLVICFEMEHSCQRFNK